MKTQVKRKSPLTLLEIIIVMILLGFLLTGLFNVFRQAMKKNIESRNLKQTLLQLELFEQKIKHLLTQTKKMETTSHPEAKGDALLIQFTPEVDIEWDRASEIEGMLYLNAEKELCFVSWSASGKSRIEILLDKVDGFACDFFDPKQKQWKKNWPPQTEEIPAMIHLDITWRGKEIPFAFFPSNAKEQISYLGAP